MKFRTINLRYAILLCLAALLVVSGLLYLVRYRSFAAEREVVRLQFSNLVSVEQARAASVRLGRSKRDMRLALDKEAARVAKLERRLAPTAGDQQRLATEISRLALASGLKVQETVFPFGAIPVSSARRQAPPFVAFLGRYPKATIRRRQVLRMRAEGTFDGLQSFVRGLESLEWHVTVVQFEILAASGPGAERFERLRTRSTLRATLMLVL